MNKVYPILLSGAALAALVAFSCSTESKKKKKNEAVTATLPSPTPNPGLIVTPGAESPSPDDCTAACSDSLKVAFTAGRPAGARYWDDGETVEANGTQVNGEILDIPLARRAKAVELKVETPKLEVRLELATLEKKPYTLCGQTCSRYEVTLPDATRGWYYCESFEGEADAKTAAEKDALCATEKARCVGGAVKTSTYSSLDGGHPMTRVYWSCGG